MKDIPLVEFSLYVSYEEIFDSVAENYSIKIKKVHHENKHLLPKKLSSNLNEAELLKWINHRKAPKNRQFVEKILSAIDDSDNPSFASILILTNKLVFLCRNVIYQDLENF